LTFQTQLEFKKWVKIQNQYNIPSNPQSVYEKLGWIDWGTFLGNNKNRNYLSFEDARNWARKSGIISAKEWKSAKKKNLLSVGIPGHPQIIYQNKGWQSWAEFLGTDNERNIEYFNFNDARNYVRQLKLINTKDWKKWSRKGRPKFIPATPDNVYKALGWISWADFLDANIAEKGNKLEYSEAKKVIKQFGVKSSIQWRNFVKTERMPNNIPTNPDREYKNKGWNGWANFLGKEDEN
jgi:hypothetical protein